MSFPIRFNIDLCQQIRTQTMNPSISTQYHSMIRTLKGGQMLMKWVKLGTQLLQEMYQQKPIRNPQQSLLCDLLNDLLDDFVIS